MAESATNTPIAGQPNANEEYTFRGQRSDEAVLLVARGHVWKMAPAFLVWLIVILIMIPVFMFFGASKYTSWTLVAFVVWGLFYTFYRWFIWNNGLAIITNQRVIKIEQRGLFSRQINEAELARIQEISTEISGPIRTMLNFGTVKIQTASSTAKVDLEDVPSPYDIQQSIVRAQKELGTTHSTTEL